MSQCSAFCKDGGACRHAAKPGQSVCGKHASQALPLKPVYIILCGQRMTDGTKCKCPREKGKKLCKRHFNVEVKRVRRQAIEDLWGDALDFLWEGLGRPQDLPAYVAGRLVEIEGTPREHERMGEWVVDELDFYYTIHPQVGDGLGAPRTELEALTMDAQNVHTPVARESVELMS